MDIKAVVETIHQIKDGLSAKKLRDWDGDRLSGAIGELALLKINLGIAVAEMEEAFLRADKERKMAEIVEYKRLRENNVSQKDAELNAKFETLEILDDCILKESQLKKMKLLREDTADLIDALRSRLSYLKQEKAEANL